VHFEDGGAATTIGPVDDHAPVEAPRSQQRRIEDIGPVRGGDDHDGLALVEAVHLDEELIQRLLALIVAAAEAGAALATDGIKLVNENYRGRVLLRIFEETAHARGADAHEHLDELGGRDAEKGHAGLAGDGPRQQRLPGTRGADQQHALGHAATQFLELLRVPQKIDHLLQLELRLLDARDIMKGRLGRARLLHAGAAAAEAENALGRLAAPSHEPDPDGDQDEER
jgi:hypothetical protein